MPDAFPLQVAIPLFDRFTALDAVGPYEVLSRLQGAEVTWPAHTPGPVRSDNGTLTLTATASFEDVPAPDVVLVPGGPGTGDLLEDERLLAWLRLAHTTAQWTTSVCTGSLLLGAAGILDGLPATSHWLVRDRLAAFGAQPVDERVVVAGHVVTAAGVSAGIDMALWLAGQIAGTEAAQAIQLQIEYDPQPPWDAGSPRTAPPQVVAAVRERAAGRG